MERPKRTHFRHFWLLNLTYLFFIASKLTATSAAHLCNGEKLAILELYENDKFANLALDDR